MYKYVIIMSHELPFKSHEHESFSKSSPYLLTSKDYYYASMAANAGHDSTMTSKHGCVATCGSGHLLATATNCIRSCSKEGFLGDQCSCHAEIHALRKLYYSHVLPSFQTNRKRLVFYNGKKMRSFYSKITLYVVRVGKNNEWYDSSPCEQCANVLKLLNVKRIVFTNKDGLLEKHNPKYYNTSFTTTGNMRIKDKSLSTQHNFQARHRRLELLAKYHN